MIISLTVNPAVDQTVWVERLEPGTVHRVRGTQVDPAGKGVNVSRIVHRLGTAAGAATASAVGTALGSPEQVAALRPQVRIEALS